MNVVAFFHAYKFTHFSTSGTRTNDPKELSFLQKIEILFTGVNQPRPVNKFKPAKNYKTVILQSNKKIECWLIETDSAKGTMILFHGYGGEKSSMLDKAEIFLDLGYNALLVDFMGSGGSEGNVTTIGFKEAKQVKTTVEYLKIKGEENIILFGTSLGAAAVMKAMCDDSLAVKSIILECPFSTMLKTVQNRFSNMGVPTFPMANLLVFWGGVQNNFNAFSHNPVEYAKEIKTPTLLLYGGKDDRVTKEEIDAIFKNLAGKKTLITYPLAAHENYLRKYKNEWTADIKKFLENTTTPQTSSLSLLQRK